MAVTNFIGMLLPASHMRYASLDCESICTCRRHVVKMGAMPAAASLAVLGIAIDYPVLLKVPTTGPVPVSSTPFPLGYDGNFDLARCNLNSGGVIGAGDTVLANHRS